VSELTADERAALDDWWSSDWPRDGRDVVDVLAEVVAGIAAARVAAALAPVEALVVQWEAEATTKVPLQWVADDLRAALTAAEPDRAAAETEAREA
jgi:hypothetical protein